MDTSTTHPDENLEFLDQHIAALIDRNGKARFKGTRPAQVFTGPGTPQTGSAVFGLQHSGLDGIACRPQASQHKQVMN